MRGGPLQSPSLSKHSSSFLCVARQHNVNSGILFTASTALYYLVRRIISAESVYSYFHNPFSFRIKSGTYRFAFSFSQRVCPSRIKTPTVQKAVLLFCCFAKQTDRLHYRCAVIPCSQSAFFRSSSPLSAIVLYLSFLSFILSGSGGSIPIFAPIG